MRTFSPGTFQDVESLVVVDQAPGTPSFETTPKYVNGNVVFTAKLNPKDFDGSALTGTDELHVVGAFYNDDGSSPIDNLGGQQALDGGFVKLTIPVNPTMAANGEIIPVTFPQTPDAGGKKFRVGMYTSDGTP